MHPDSDPGIAGAGKQQPAPYHPPPGRPGWSPGETEALELLYLAWGWRRYAETPMYSDQREGWIYFTPRRGTPAFLQGKRRMILHPGEIVLIDPACACGWDDAAGASAEVCTWVWRSPSRWPALRPPAGGYLRKKLPDGVRRAVWQLHQSTRQEVQQGDEYMPAALEVIRLQLDLVLARAFSGRPQPATDAHRLALARRWLEEHSDCPHPVSSLCDYLQLSASTLHRLFRRTLGTDVRTYARDERTRRARALIEEKGLSVKEAAYLLGYRFPNDLSRALHRPAVRSRIAHK